MEKTIVVCGATATGKTEQAILLAKHFNTEIISADSQLVYKGLNIGTAKPTAADMQEVKHYLIDVVEPTANFSVADYNNLAEQAIIKLEGQGKHPIVCGGTGFYIQSILFKRSMGAIASDSRVRQKYQDIANERGNAYLWQQLYQVDAESATKLHKNDVYRVIRALEIFELTGQKKSAQSDSYVPKRPYIALMFNYDRIELYKKIDERVLKMLQLGWIDEVQTLLKAGVQPDMQSMQAIGYREIVSYLNNTLKYNDMLALIQQKTRNYAKRQITFFKKLPNLQYIEPNTNCLQKIKAML